VSLQVQRGTQTFTFQVPVVERHDDPARFTDMVSPERNLVPKLGILGLDLTDQIAPLLPRLRSKTGVVVAASAGDALYWEEHFEPGDVIHALNGAPVTSLEGLRGMVAKLQVGAPIAAQVERQGEMLYVAFEVE
jgi:S1-C subfamily serine protease